MRLPVVRKHLKDAVNETMREWTQRVHDTHYVLGSVMGPHPFPTIVRDFQSVIGREVKEQMLEEEGRLPDAVIACVGGGSNAMGIFYDFIEDTSVRLSAVKLPGMGLIPTKRCNDGNGFRRYFPWDEILFLPR